MAASRRGNLPPLRSATTTQGQLAYALSGSGRPHIVLLNGAGVGIEGWRGLYPHIEQWGTVLCWNRFGLPGTEPPRAPQTGRVVVASLREVLAAARLAPPYVLVGHSLGGLFANLFARLHPRDVEAVLLVEATHPRDREVLQAHETQLVRAIGKVLAWPQWLVRPNVHSELAAVERTVRELDAAGPFPAVPLRVVTGGRTPPASLLSPAAAGAKRAHQQELARLSPHGEQMIAQKSGHFPQLTQPQIVLDALASLIDRGAAPGRPAPTVLPA